MATPQDSFPDPVSPSAHLQSEDIDALAERVHAHNIKYFIENKPEISDFEFDQLRERLKALNPGHPVLIELFDELSSDSAHDDPHKIGADQEKKSRRKKIRHDVPMLSIEKVFEVSDVVEWAQGAGAFDSVTPDDGIIAGYKVDGSSCSLIYDDGMLVHAATRGTGLEGDDITANAKTILGIPHEISALKGCRIEVRGEIYMSIQSFQRALEKFERELLEGQSKEQDRPVNPRNYCAGSIKLDDPDLTRERGLSFMAHGCFGKIPGSDGKSEASQQLALTTLGFESAFIKLVQKPEDVDAVVTAVEKQRKQLLYEIDGIVFAINRLSLHQELGSTSHHPRYRLAYKFSRDRGETTVKRIIWHTTRSGRVSPAMEVDPISLGGATVTLCSLHNARIVKESGVKPGDRVLLEREVIPYFVKKVTIESPGEPTAVLPERCGSCGSDLSWDETKTNLICKNLGGCPSQLLDYLSYYVSRSVVNMMGIGEKLISKLIEADLLRTPVDFYKLTEEQIREEIERQGETSAKNMIAAIQTRKEQTLETFLVSLGIRGLGPAVAGRLVAHFGTLSELLKADEPGLMNVEGVAETLSATLYRGLRERQLLMDELLQHVRLTQTEKVEGTLSGKSFCLTGHVEFDYSGVHYDARPQIEALIKSKGGQIKNVTKTLNYLVVGAEPGSKVEKAKKAGVEVLDAAGLIRLLE